MTTVLGDAWTVGRGGRGRKYGVVTSLQSLLPQSRHFVLSPFIFFAFHHNTREPTEFLFEVHLPSVLLEHSISPRQGATKSTARRTDLLSLSSKTFTRPFCRKPGTSRVSVSFAKHLHTHRGTKTSSSSPYRCLLIHLENKRYVQALRTTNAKAPCDIQLQLPLFHYPSSQSEANFY